MFLYITQQKRKFPRKINDERNQLKTIALKKKKARAKEESL